MFDLVITYNSLFRTECGQYIGRSNCNLKMFSMVRQSCQSQGLHLMTRRLIKLPRDSGGAALVEFTLVFPILLALLFGAIQFGLLFNNYLMLTNATNAGAREFAASACINGAPAGTAYHCGTTTPLTNTTCQMYVSAANVFGAPPASYTTACQSYASAQVSSGVIPKVPTWSTPETAFAGTLTITLAVQSNNVWTNCTTDTACDSALNPSKVPPPQAVSVVAQYPCDIVPGLNSLFSFISPCNLSSTTKLIVQ
jgi:Flp pilus assembly protein TadG